MQEPLFLSLSLNFKDELNNVCLCCGVNCAAVDRSPNLIPIRPTVVKGSKLYLGRLSLTNLDSNGVSILDIIAGSTKDLSYPHWYHYIEWY
jgi:hypothetical protein